MSDTDARAWVLAARAYVRWQRRRDALLAGTGSVRLYREAWRLYNRLRPPQEATNEQLGPTP